MNILSRCCLALLLCASATAFAANSAADSIAVLDATVRLVPPGARATAAFMTLKNAGDKDVRLVKAKSAAAKKHELHTHTNENGVMSMRQVAAITVKAKGQAALEPGGYHIMMIDPAALKEGDKVAITLGFDDGSSKQVEAIVTKPQAASAMMGQSGHMDHSGNDQKR